MGFVLANNFTLSAFSLFVDQLRLAADEGDGSPADPVPLGGDEHAGLAGPRQLRLRARPH